MIEWLIQRAADDPRLATGLPPDGFLSPSEAAVFDNLSSAKRRKDWLLGRWTAKRLVKAVAESSGANDPPYKEISILAARDGAPEVWFGEQEPLERGDLNISISHSRGVSLCAAIAPAACSLGADIEYIESRSASFVNDYFTAAEIETVRRSPTESQDRLVTAIWSGKEAALKVVRQGLRVDTRIVNCGFQPFNNGAQGWRRFTAGWENSRTGGNYPTMTGWWRVWQDFVLTLVVAGEA